MSKLRNSAHALIILAAVTAVGFDLSTLVSGPDAEVSSASIKPTSTTAGVSLERIGSNNSNIKRDGPMSSVPAAQANLSDATERHSDRRQVGGNWKTLQ